LRAASALTTSRYRLLQGLRVGKLNGCGGGGTLGTLEFRHGRLAELLRANLRTVRANLLKEDCHAFWGYASPGWAGRFLDRWTTDALRSRIAPFAKLARTLRKHRSHLLSGLLPAGPERRERAPLSLTERPASRSRLRSASPNSGSRSTRRPSSVPAIGRGVKGSASTSCARAQPALTKHFVWARFVCSSP